MTRSAAPYASRREFVAPEGVAITTHRRRVENGNCEGLYVEAPIPGYYRFRFGVSGNPNGTHPVGIHIWHGPPLDPETGDEMDRGHRWQAHYNGQYIDIDRVWPGCGGDPIDRAEYDYLTSVQAWGKENAPNSPQANPFKPIDLLTAPIAI